MNYIIEEECERTVCPMGVGANVIHHNGVPAGKACIGRKCAGWRWETIVDSWNDETETWDIHYSDIFGFCGIVGE
jgi:hypothetical protein